MFEACPKCGQSITKEDVFCSHCGTQLVSNTAISNAQKIKIYVLSFLLAPFGLFWFFKYIKEDDQDKKMVAKRVLVITVIAIAVMLTMGIVSANKYHKLLDEYSGIYGY